MPPRQEECDGGRKGKPALERPVRTAVPSTDENMAIAMRIMRVRGITPGSIAGRIGMSRSRAYRLMAKDSDKRTTVRVDEIDAILRDLGVDRYQLAVISELGERADASLEEDLQIAIFQRSYDRAGYGARSGPIQHPWS